MATKQLIIGVNKQQLQMMHIVQYTVWLIITDNPKPRSVPFTTDGALL